MPFLTAKKGTEVDEKLEQCEWQLKQLEQSREECYINIGRLFARKNTAKQVEGTPYEETILELEKLEARKEILEKRKLALQNLRKCEKCGAVLSLDSMFCNKCGEKLEEIAPEVMTDAPLCPSCKKPIEEGSTFCTHCGASINAETQTSVKSAMGNAKGNVCPVCGTVCDASDAFCISCGAKLNG